jgi:hypothetical protein
MTIKTYPTKFEGYENNEPIFSLSAIDEYGAELKVSTILNLHIWDELAPIIRECLSQMNLET